MATLISEPLASISRTPLGVYPTPLEPLGRLQKQLAEAGPRLFIKRDDYTGFAMGGNKVRKLEYMLAPEVVRQTDVIITTGGFGSNHARVTAAAAAKLGKRCILVLNGKEPDPPRGNALLQRLFGAEIVVVATREERAARSAAIAEELRERGLTPLLIPLGASTPVGALGYVRASFELAAQLRDAGIGPETVSIVVSASSCGTLAGLIAGLHLAGLHKAQLVGVSPDISAADMRSTSLELAAGVLNLLGLPAPDFGEWPTAEDGYVGAGYGVPTAESRNAIDLFARNEGILLDPVYTAKAAAGMIDWLRTGRFARERNMVFLHTGGAPALLAE